MASCQTTRWGNNNSSPYMKLTVTEKESNETSVTLSWVLEYIADYAAEVKYKKEYSATIAGEEVASGFYDINGKTGTKTVASGTKIISKTKETQTVAFSLSFKYNGYWSNIWKDELTASGTISVAAKTKYTIKYNLNGGSGTFSDQTKWHAENLTIHSGSPTRSGYTFKGWALTKAKADAGEWYYTPGSTCGKNENLTLYAVWAASSYTVSYNANGGSGAPSSQTKSPDAELTLSSTVPTRSGYDFKGWSNSASSSTVLYRPGDKYKTNASITLYAVWTTKPPPGITNFTVDRCDSDKTLNENGQYVLVRFDYSVGAESVNAGAFDIYAYEFGSSTLYTSSIMNLVTKESDSVSVLLGSSSNLFDVEKSYTIRVELGDIYGHSSEASLVLGEAADSLEFIPGNKGVRLPKDVHGNVFGLANLPVLDDGTDFNDVTATGVFSVKMNASAVTMVNCPDSHAGRLMVAKSIGWDDPETNYAYLLQTYIPYLNIYPTYERYIRRDDSSTWIYSDWKVKSFPTKDIAFTPADGVTVNRCMLCRNNDIVTMYLSCKVTTAMTAGTTKQIGTIASGFPYASVATVGMQNDTLVACWVRNDGKVNIRVPTAYTANKDIEFNMTWNVAATWS